MPFIFVPLIAWVAAGFIKFLLYFYRFRQLKPAEFFRYGGFPSAHTSLVSSAVFFAGLTAGFATPVFSIGLALVLIVITDAHGLRGYIGQQARIVNQLQQQSGQVQPQLLPENIAHSWPQIFGGLITGLLTAAIAYWLTT